MMDAVEAIETRYAGCRFRSRLEARWAVFFDALGVAWDYELEGYETSQGRYLPDFFLPNQDALCRCMPDKHEIAAVGIHAEVKGSATNVSDLNKATMSAAVEGRGSFCSGLLLLGPIPELPENTTGVVHGLVNMSLGSPWPQQIQFSKQGKVQVSMMNWPLVGSDVWDWAAVPYFVSFHPTGRSSVVSGWQIDAEVRAAYAAARSARFEHGETGRFIGVEPAKSLPPHPFAASS